jgi:hypothetical protein
MNRTRRSQGFPLSTFQSPGVKWLTLHDRPAPSQVWLGMVHLLSQDPSPKLGASQTEYSSVRKGVGLRWSDLKTLRGVPNAVHSL